MQQVLTTLQHPQVMSIISSMEKTFSSLPHLPKGITEFFVKIAPWLALIGGILTILGGLSNVFSPANPVLDLLAVNRSYFIIMGLFQLVSGALLLMSFQYLKDKQFPGWLIMFWTTVLGLVQSLIGMIYGIDSIIGVVIGAAIGFYILFEMKSHYKPVASRK